MRLHFSKLTFGFVFFLTFCMNATASQWAQGSDSLVCDYLKSEWNVDFSDNNRLVVFKTGQEKFDDLFKAISVAKSSIHLEYFNFRNDSISSLLFDLLTKKASEGVEVRAVFDGFGNTSNDRPLKKRHLEQLRNKGIEIVEFDPMNFPWIDNALHRDHRKIVVIDGKIAYTGGMNVADYYIEGKPEFGEWRDLHVRVEGDIVADLQGVFINFWNEITNQHLGGTKYYPGLELAAISNDLLQSDTSSTAGRKVIGMTNRVPGLSDKIIHDTFLYCIRNAQKEIKIVTPYFTLCRHLRDALEEASERGVNLEIMISEKCDIPLTPRISEYNFGKLIKKGAKVYVFQGGFHHSKVMMVDGCYSYLGSANMNGRSLSFDYECNLMILDKSTTKILVQIFEEDKKGRCFQMTKDRYSELSFWKKIKGWLAHFLIPFV